ncbi:hypothetical protein ACOSP7_004749 [Xanthoceras sorbifolium]
MDCEEISRICVNLSLSDLDGPVARFRETIQERGRLSMSMSLFGRIITNKEINREAFRYAIPRLWRIKSEFEVESIRSNTFVFHFKCAWDRKRVLEGGHWNFDKNLINLCEARGIGKVANCDFLNMALWVQLHNLPLAYMNKKLLMRGLRVMMEDPDELCLALIKYERLPRFCYHCGRIGHLVRECYENVKKVTNESLMRFGSWMRAAGGNGGRNLGGQYAKAGGNSQDNYDKSNSASEADPKTTTAWILLTKLVLSSRNNQGLMLVETFYCLSKYP